MNRFVVDTNIVFSGILNTNSSIGDLLLNSEPFLKFYPARRSFQLRRFIGLVLGGFGAVVGRVRIEMGRHRGAWWGSRVALAGMGRNL